MKKLFVVFFCFLFASLSCDNSKADNDNDTKMQEVENFIVDYYNVLSYRNWSAYQDFFSDKESLAIILQKSTGTKSQVFTNTISEFIAQTANRPDIKPIFEGKPIEIDDELKNNLASAWVQYEAWFGSENELLEWKGYDLFSLLKFNDKWYIKSLTYVSDESE